MMKYTVKNVYGIMGESSHRTAEAALREASRREGCVWMVHDDDGNRWTWNGDTAVKV
ncbi:MAG: hypothetical protein IH951_11730 [Bacteroidetes bacterium]|nr:hypothetical protein [Bacteroidota bacterium]